MKQGPARRPGGARLSVGRAQYYATDNDVRHAVRSLPFYTNGRASQRTLVMRWLEESFGSKEPVSLGKLTIEHVLPQNVGRNGNGCWPRTLPRGDVTRCTTPWCTPWAT